MSHSQAGLYKLCLTTVDKDETAKAIAKQLLQQKLVACVNIQSKVTSLYIWQGNIEQQGEVLLIMKTRKEKLAALQKVLLAIHPYDVAEFIVLDIQDGNQEYLAWIDESLSL